MDNVAQNIAVAKFYAQQSLAYKWDIMAEIVSMVFNIFLLVYFWSLAGEIAALDDSVNRVGYFFLSVGCFRLTAGQNFQYIGTLSKDVKSGAIGQMMLLPYDVYKHNAIKTVMSRSPLTALTAVLYALGIAIVASDFSHAALATAMLAIMIPVGYYFSKLVAGLSFVIVEMHTLRMSLSIVSKLLTGMFVPLVFYPGLMQRALELSPFSYLAYWSPAAASGIEFNAWLVAATGIFWIVVLRWASDKVFNRLQGRIEVVGL